jgi:hypothetical protein
MRGKPDPARCLWSAQLWQICVVAFVAAELGVVVAAEGSQQHPV